MKHVVPMLKIPQLICAEELSPKSEELREGVESKHSPFTFQTNNTSTRLTGMSRMSPSTSYTTERNNSYLRLVETQQKEIQILRKSNYDLQRRIEYSEKEVKGLRRLKILLREKDRAIKGLEDNLETISKDIKALHDCKTDKKNDDEPKLMMSHEYFKANPPKRVWNHPAPEFAGKINHLREQLKILMKGNGSHNETTEPTSNKT
ncbi:hypothetical protein SteCoe_30701 [Stentor coeruleus]|uniref:Uncharacterized protein n=1 Tax=Stentor coeruleus TaxID=5963 RepID=A0A1R2B336_9CILI|nr:hypothetical protein SteCoe_30701 [Stentor coeruleus]